MAKKNKVRAISKTFDVNDEGKRYKHLLPAEKYEPGTSATFIIDGMNLAHAAKHTYAKLTHKGKSVSLLFGVPQMLRSIINLHKPAKLIVVWDGRRSKRRMKLLPEYKSHRDAARDPELHALFLKQVEKLKKLLYRLGIPQAHNEKIEGDDMIYKVAQREVKIRKVVIVSGDKDFNQLVTYDIMTMKPKDKFKQTPFGFSNQYGVEIPQFVDYLCLLGDHSDDIPGIAGIGPVRATAFLRKWYTIDEFFADKKSEFLGMQDKKKAYKILMRNRKLIDLKYFDQRYNSKLRIKYFKDKAFPKFNLEKYMAICAKYNLKTMMAGSFYSHFQKLNDE